MAQCLCFVHLASSVPLSKGETLVADEEYDEEYQEEYLEMLEGMETGDD